MTDQGAAERPGVWDALFGLVFGRRRAPAPRPTPAPPPAPPPPVADAPPPPPPPIPEPQVEPAPPPIAETPAEPELPPVPVIVTPEIEAPAATGPSAFVSRVIGICDAEWEYFERHAVKENSEKGSPRVAQYWQRVDKPDWDGHTPQPWSAAFVSYCMTQGEDGGRFRKSTGHCDYINAGLRGRNDPNAAFQAYRLDEYAPQLGDLVAGFRPTDAWRAEGKPDVTYDNALGLGWYPSHTDIVTEVKPGEIWVTGGNVSNTVYRRRIPTGPDGKILANQAGPPMRLFAVMKNNI